MLPGLKVRGLHPEDDSGKNLEKPEAFAAGGSASSVGVCLLNVGDVGGVGERASFEGGEGIIDEEGAGNVFARAGGDEVEGFLQLQRAAGDVVGVAGEEVDGAGVEPSLGGFLGGLAEAAEKGPGGDLNVAALLKPFEEAFGLSPDEGIAFGMRDDGTQASELELVENLVHGGRD